MKLLWQQIPSPLVSEILCNGNEDGVVLDLEHAVFNPETIYGCIQVIQLKGKLAFVRTPPDEKTLVRHALDTGCDGVIFSTIEEEEKAKDLLSTARFPPDIGRRGLGLVRDNLWGQKGVPLRKPITVAQIETTRGVMNLNDRKLDGFDYYMIGPYDLSLSVGCPGDFHNPDLEEHIKRFEESLSPEKRGFHIVNNYQENFQKYKSWGLLAFGLDTLMIQQGVQEVGRL